MNVGDYVFHVPGLSEEVLHIRMKHVIVLRVVSVVYTGDHTHLLLKKLNTLFESRYHPLLLCKRTISLNLHISSLFSAQL